MENPQGDKLNEGLNAHEDASPEEAKAGGLPEDAGLDDELEEVLPPVAPKKRNIKKIVFTVIGLALVALVAINIIAGMLAGPPPVSVQAQQVVLGSVQQTLATSGILTTGQRVTVYSPVTAPINQMDIEAGSLVAANSQIVSFDTVALNRSFEQARANLNLAYSQAQVAIEASTDSQQSANEYQESINHTQVQLGNAQSYAASVGAQYTAAQQAVQALTAEIETLTAQLAALSAGDPAYAQTQADLDAKRSELAAKALELAELYAAVEAAGQDVAYQQGLISQMQTLQQAAEAAVLSEQQENQLYYQQVPSRVAFEIAQENLEAGLAGVCAPIGGVVVSVSTEEGALANQYAPLCTIESLDEVNVIVALSRYDLERVQLGQQAIITTAGQQYAASVTKINGMATISGTSRFVNCTVSITEPDSNIRLGLEADVKISTGQVDNTIVVPIMAVKTDVTGTYCYVVENGVARRADVTLGLSSEANVEIISGLQVGQQVIVGSFSIADGTAVAVPATSQL